MELSVAGNYSSEIKLSGKVKTELEWWVQHLHLHNGRSVVSYPTKLIIVSGAFLQRSCAFCQGHKTGTHWTLSEKKGHIHMLKPRAAKYAILTFTRLYPTVKMDKWAMLLFLLS